MLKNLLIGLVIIAVAALAVLFAWLNPSLVQLDLAFASYEISIAMAVTAGVVLGWLFGLACAVAYITTLMRQRRRLRKALKLAEAEVSNLRGLPTQDAG
jgi:uncharacterized membrane protein YciS (DUF1049 family)